MPILVGAGVVPFLEKDGDVHFALGKERYVRDWSGSRTWSGFQGGCIGGETSLDTACREFDEETLSSMPSCSSTLRQTLEEGRYSLRITVCSRARRHHVTYLVPLPSSDAGCVRSFEETRRHVLAAEAAQRRMRELERVVWEHNAEGRAPSLPLPGEGSRRVLHVAFAKHVMVVTFAAREGGEEEESGAEEELRIDTREVPEEAVRAYANWFGMRWRLTRATDAILASSSAAVRSVVRCPHCSLVESATFKDAYLEKDTILFWSLSELRRHLVEGDLSPFKTTFHPILHSIVHEFSAHGARELPAALPQDPAGAPFRPRLEEEEDALSHPKK